MPKQTKDLNEAARLKEIRECQHFPSSTEETLLGNGRVEIVEECEFCGAKRTMKIHYGYWA